MPRLALVKNTFLPPSETFVYQQLGALRRYEPLLFVRETANADRFPIHWPCSTLTAGGLGERLGYMLSGRAPRFERDAARWRPALVHAHFAVDGVYALGLADALGLPLAVTLHAYDIVKLPQLPSRHLAWWMHALRYRELQRRGDAFIVVSAAMREAAIARGYPADRLHLIPLGVDLDALSPPPLREAAGPLRVLHVGRLVEKKGLALLIAAIAQRVAAGDAVELTVIGEGPLRKALERQAAPLGARVRFLGAQPPAAVRAAMAAAQVFCLPSRRDRQGDMEGLPVALMEAGAMELAIVASAHSGIVELLEDGKSGLLVPEGEVQALADALARLAREPALRARLGAAARARVAAGHELRTQTARLEDLFDALIAERAPRPSASSGVAASVAPAASSPRHAAGPAAFAPGDQLAGFRVGHLYHDAAGCPLGARLSHARTAFTLDLLAIPSVPQGFFWVKTLARTERGEAHACEHLLLGKGAKGRAVAALEELTLSASSAWTGQLSTAYHFHTLAGEEGFRRNLAARLDALLHPDFSDAEARREVAELSVVAERGTGRLALEDKGTLLAELTSSSEGPGTPLWTGIAELLYGPGHPQALNAGGRPDALWSLSPAALRAYHAEFYRPAGMGLIASLPPAIDRERFVETLDGILARVWPGADATDTPGIQGHRLPPAAPQTAPGTLALRPYASMSATSPAQAVFAWPARLALDPLEILSAELFLDTLAGGPGSPLYADLVASQSRRLATGASAVYGYHSDEPGHPLMIGLAGLNPEGLDEARLAAIRALIVERIATIHAWPAADPALRAFNREAASRLAARGKELRQALDQPPQFGFRRGQADYWESLLGLLERAPGERRSLVLAESQAALADELGTGENGWRGAIERWGLLAELPRGLAVRPEPALLHAAAQAKRQRLAAAADALAAAAGGDLQRALAQRLEATARESAALAAAAAKEPIPEFLQSPPLSLDEELDFRPLTLPGGVPLVASRFAALSTATLGLAFRLDVLPESRLHLVPLLPDLLTQAGLTLEGERLDTEAMQERLRHELSAFGASFDLRPESGRCELVLRASAAGEAEQGRLFVWLEAALGQPRLDAENLPRLRDLAAQEFSRLRTRMQAAEEAWVQEPALAWRVQHDPLQLSAGCFLTALHHSFRLVWLLADPGDARDAAALAHAIDGLAALPAEREALIAACRRAPALAPEASPTAYALAEEAQAALAALLPDLPTESLAEDWARLCATLRADLLSPPAATLAALEESLAALVHADNCRAFLIANAADGEALLPALESWAARLPTGPSRRQRYAARPRVLERLRERRPVAAPRFVGLLDPNTRTGTLLFSARLASPWSAEPESARDALIGQLYAGGGGHGLFMRTWSAGLAYSNGVRFRARSGLLSYYAERCPDVAETLHFAARVIGEGQVDAARLRYALAVAFNQSRAAGPYEQRGEAMAADLADGVTPARVRAHRLALLALRDEPGLIEEFAARLPAVYGSVLPGLGRPLAESREGVFFLIGPEAQFAALEALLAAEAPDAPPRVERLAPRDFWLLSSPRADGS